MSKRIIVVDDDKITIQMCEYILKQQGYEVISALSGKRCLEYLRDEKKSTGGLHSAGYRNADAERLQHAVQHTAV